MARPEKKLSTLAVKAAKPLMKEGKARAMRLSDGGGLYLHVSPSGSKSWVYVWKSKGRKREMGLGAARAATKEDAKTSLQDARDMAAVARSQVKSGLDPIRERDKRDGDPTFKECIDIYIADRIEFKQMPDGRTRGLKNEKSRQQWKMTLNVYAKPLHDVRVSQITIDDVLGILKPIWDTKQETASRLQMRIERILSYATALGWREGDNPARWTKNLDNVLPAKQGKKAVRNHPSLPHAEMPAFMGKLAERPAITALCVEFAILTGARSKQAREATFDEVDMSARVWSLSAERMKMAKGHDVPLCNRAFEIVSELSELRRSDFMFPAPSNAKKSLSENAARNLLIRMNYSHITLHGFRATFKTWATGHTNFQREIIEMAMAHSLKNEAEEAYLRETAVEKRRKLMQAWSDYIYGMQSADVIQFGGL